MKSRLSSKIWTLVLVNSVVLFAVLGATSLGELSQVWNEVSAAAGSAGRAARCSGLAATPRPIRRASSTPC